GDEGDPVPGDPSTWLSLTHTQYARFQAWAANDFTNAAPSNDKAGDNGMLALVESLTRTPLEACAGGAFYPGIEMTSIAREAALYSAAFRLNHHSLKPGDVTKYMALPWQADFWECRDHWWPAQRPDDVITNDDFELLLSQFTEEISGTYRQRF